MLPHVVLQHLDRRLQHVHEGQQLPTVHSRKDPPHLANLTYTQGYLPVQDLNKVVHLVLHIVPDILDQDAELVGIGPQHLPVQEVHVQLPLG